MVTAILESILSAQSLFIVVQQLSFSETHRTRGPHLILSNRNKNTSTLAGAAALDDFCIL